MGTFPLADQYTYTHTDKQKETDRHIHKQDNCFSTHDQNFSRYTACLILLFEYLILSIGWEEQVCYCSKIFNIEDVWFLKKIRSWGQIKWLIFIRSVVYPFLSYALLGGYQTWSLLLFGPQGQGETTDLKYQCIILWNIALIMTRFFTLVTCTTREWIIFLSFQVTWSRSRSMTILLGFKQKMLCSLVNSSC